MLIPMQHLHVVPYKYFNISIIAKYSLNIAVFNEISNFTNNENTINGITFNVNELAAHYVISPYETIQFVWLLNFIYNTVVFHLDSTIEKEITLNNQKGSSLITSIQHCNAAEIFF